MAENKTQPTMESVTAFLEGIENKQRREDSFVVLEMMKEITGYEPVMWGPSIVGFGKYHYKYASGREGDSALTGFSPRKQALTLYITAGFTQYDDLMQKLGRHTTGSSCLYIKKLADIDQAVLRELITKSVEHMKATNEVVE
jgi:hypothetical protein